MQGVPVAGSAPQAGSVGPVLAESYAPANGAVDPGELVTMRFTLLNGGGGASQNLTATLLASPGIQPVGAIMQSYGAIGPGDHSERPFTLIAQGACGGKVTAILALSDGSADLGRAEFEIQLGPVPVVTVLEHFDSGPTLPAGWSSSSAWSIGPDDAVLPTKHAVGTALFGPDSYLESPPYLLPSGTNQLRFRQVWSVASNSATARLMISVTGAPFVNAASLGVFSVGPYNGRSATDGAPTWHGASDLPFVRVALDLPAELSGQSVRLRFQTTGAPVNWYLDQLELANWSGSRCPQAAPAFTSALPSTTAVIGVPFVHRFVAAGNPPPTFSVIDGKLPPGLALSPSGLLLGLPSFTGNVLFPNITVAATNGVSPTTTQVFTLQLVTTGPSYLAGLGLSGPAAGLLADSNADGVNNLLAYALGLSPALPQASFLPQPEWVTVGHESYLRLVFPRSALATDLTYLVEASADLENWTVIAASVAGAPATGPGVVAEIGSAPNFQVEVRVPATTSPGFLRLRVTSP